MFLGSTCLYCVWLLALVCFGTDKILRRLKVCNLKKMEEVIFTFLFISASTIKPPAHTYTQAPLHPVYFSLCQFFTRVPTQSHQSVASSLLLLPPTVSCGGSSTVQIPHHTTVFVRVCRRKCDQYFSFCDLGVSRVVTIHSGVGAVTITLKMSAN